MRCAVARLPGAMSPPKKPDPRGPAAFLLGDYALPPVAGWMAATMGLSAAPSLLHQEVSREDGASPETEGAEGTQAPTGSGLRLSGSVGATGANASSTVSETILVTSNGASFAWSDAGIVTQTGAKRT